VSQVRKWILPVIALWLLNWVYPTIAVAMAVMLLGVALAAFTIKWIAP
jgi:hypothetical protein